MYYEDPEIVFLFKAVTTAFFVFLGGVIGIILNRRVLLLVLLAFEIILLSSVLSYSAFALILDDWNYLLYTFILISLGAAESIVVLSLFVSMYSTTNKTLISELTLVRYC